MWQKSIYAWLLVVGGCGLFARESASILAQEKPNANKGQAELAVTGEKQKMVQAGSTVSPKSNLKVGRVLASEQFDGHLILNPSLGLHQSDLKLNHSNFRVESPEWYEQFKASSAERSTVFSVFGLNRELLEKEVKGTLKACVANYVEGLLGSVLPQDLDLTDSELLSLIERKEIKTGSYFDGKQTFPVEFLFAKVKFDEVFDEKVRRWWIEKRQENRLVQSGLVAGGLLSLIGLIFGGLKLNCATSGYYQGRLQFCLAIVILGVIAAGVYFGSQLDWI
ncbi:MAG: hypothetical protein VX438_01565 [Planctomycetota bacterium]|nr:hypothetical protein [Planctomycetota bacterium]